MIAQYSAKECLMYCLFIDHPGCYFHLFLYVKTTSSHLLYETQSTDKLLGISSLQDCRNGDTSSDELQAVYVSRNEFHLPSNRPWHQPYWMHAWLKFALLAMGSQLEAFEWSLLYTIQYSASAKVN